MKYFRIIILLSIVMLMNACHVARFFYYNFADEKDYRKFPEVPVLKGDEVSEMSRGEPFIPKLPDSLVDKKHPDFSAYLEKNKSLAFMVLKDDSIISEIYFKDIDSASVLASFSVTKSVVSVLAGIARDEGKIKSFDDPVTDYVADLPNGFEQIHLIDLMNMRSGLNFTEAYYNPFGHMAKFYYGTHLDKFVRQLKVVDVPGNNYQYQSANTQLLAMAVESATGMKLNEYLSEKIWKPAGMAYDASWNTDSKKHQTIKAFCCLNSSLIDFARFGLICRHRGFWNGKQIIPESYFDALFNTKNDSRDSRGYPYIMHWRVLDDGSFFAKGILGQYIYIDPKNNLVMLRFGSGSANIDWIAFFRQIREQYL